MRVTLSPALFGPSLRDVIGIIQPHPTSPILGAVLLTTEEDGVWLWGTDLDVSGRFRIQATVEREGKVALPAKRLSEIVRSLPQDQDITIDAEDERVQILCGRSRFLMPLMPAEEFPVFPDLTSPDKVMFPAPLLEKLVKSTAFAAGKEEARPGLNSVLWDLNDDAMSMVATDGRRLAWMKAKLPEPTRLQRKFIMPPKALNQVVRLTGSAEQVSVGFGDRFVSFELADAVVYTRELDTVYPDYAAVIPKETRLDVPVGCGALVAALKRAIIFSMPLTSQVRLELEEGKMVVHAECPEVGEATDEIDIEYAEEAFQIGFNGKYMLEILSHIESDQVVLKMNAPLKAALLVPEQSEEGESYTCLLMPLRLNE